MPIKQEGRICRIDTPLGKDVLFVQELRGREGLSRPFHFDLRLVSPDDAIDFTAIIGQSATLTVVLADDSERFINGIVSRFEQGRSDTGLTTYRAEIVPWLWRLTRRTDCRIFQEQTVQEIVTAVFDQLELKHYEFNLNAEYEPYVNCVQYRETDFAFVSRLLESQGIYYYFRHEDGKHTLVMADSASHHLEVPGQATARMDPSPSTTRSDDRIESWQVSQVLQPGSYALRDYNFIDPNTDLLVDTASKIEVGNNADLEIYDYPGAYVNLGGEHDGKLEKGDTLVEIRREAGDCQAEIHRGEGSCRAFASGYKFDLAEHYRDDYNTTYLLTEVEHRLSQQGNLVTDADTTTEYQNTFACIPHAVPFRPALRTPKPRVRGPQTALVTGQSGEEIYVDQYGRVKVQFHWDRIGARDETTSCWIRVAQNLAGKEWGMIFHPRIGQEVIVDFLEGDPDQPIITGRVYNGQQVIPYTEPTQSGVKTRSTKEGSTDNFNEIRFEDKKGSEELYLHAEKNETIVVENDKSESVGNDETVSIGNDRTEDVGNNETVNIGNDETRSVGSNESLTVGTNRTVTVGSNEKHEVGADRTRQVGGSETVTVGVTRTHNVGVNESIAVGGAQEVTVGGERAVSVGVSQSTTVGKDLSESIGKNLTVEAGEEGALTFGKKLKIEAADEITLVTGKAKITMKKDGTVQIEGKDVTVKGSGKINIKASKDVIVKGKKILNN